MNKELTPLEALHKIANAEMKEQYKAGNNGLVYRVISDEYSKELDIIETALKDYENEKITSHNRLLKIGELVGQINENEKKLKALEIIKNKILCITSDEFFDETIGYKTNEQLTKEEWDLLKEVLK